MLYEIILSRLFVLLLQWCQKKFLRIFWRFCDVSYFEMARRRGGNARRFEENEVRETMMLRPREKEKDQNIVEYIQYFKRIQKVNQWDDKTSGEIFAALCGNERSLNSLDGKWITFSELERLILEQQAPLREAHLATLMKLKLDGESVSSLRDKIQFLISMIYDKFSGIQHEILVRDFLLWSLPERLREKVLAGRPSTVDELVSLATVCQQQDNGFKDQINSVHSDLHLSEGVQALKFEKEVRTPVKKNYSTFRNAGENREHRERLRCWHCGKEGHTQRFCFRRWKFPNNEVNGVQSFVDQGNQKLPYE